MNKPSLRLFTIFIILFVFTASSKLFAEGSIDLYPDGATTGGRAGLMGRSTVNATLAKSWPYVNNAAHFVYVEAGETITLASSIQSWGGKSTYQTQIKLYKPDGTLATLNFDYSQEEGWIKNRDQEIAGPATPNSGAVGDEYVPIYYTAPVSGIYKVEFLSVSGDFNTGIKLPVGDGWDKNDQDAGPYIIAWDITVFDNGSKKEGRVYANVLNLELDTRKITPYAGFEGLVYVLTPDGYVYKVNNNGNLGIGFTFFSNSRGFHVKDDPTTSLYKSVKIGKVNDHYLQSPLEPDVNGSITNKIFYNKPYDQDHGGDLPDSAATAALNGAKTWLRPTEKSLSINSNTVGVLGYEGTPGQLSQKGGYIKFKSDANATYIIEIKPETGSPTFDPRTLTGQAAIGTNKIPFDGKDGSGVPIPDGAVAEVAVHLQGAEVHFPYIDMEFNPDGIIVELLNESLTSPISSTIYWNDEDLSNGSNGTDPNPKKNLTGTNSSSGGDDAHAWGTGANFNSLNSSFGNDVGIDTWTFIEGPTVTFSTPLAIKTVDLYIDDITTDAAPSDELDVGDNVTFTVWVGNKDKDKDDNNYDEADSATFSFTLPAGFEQDNITFDDPNNCGSELSGHEVTYDAQTRADTSVLN